MAAAVRQPTVAQIDPSVPTPRIWDDPKGSSQRSSNLLPITFVLEPSGTATGPSADDRPSKSIVESDRDQGLTPDW